MTDALHITGGKVYDPANGIDDEVRDVFTDGGQIVGEAAAGARVIDAAGCVIMPGGVEMHAHIASATVNAARMVQKGDVVPSAPHTDELYRSLGYTTAIEAAVAPAVAPQAHMQLDEMPNLTTGILVLMGNHETIIERLDQGDRPGAIALIAELLDATRGYGIKAVNPAAVAAWRREATRHHVDSVDDAIPNTTVTARSLLELFTEAQEQLNLPHPTHIHGPQLGEPGNVDITLDMLGGLAGRRFHLAHLQYYCYGRTKRGGFRSEVDRLLNWLADHPGATADLGLIAFGPAMTATADLPLEHALYRHLGSPARPAIFCDCENEDGFGVMPLKRTMSNPAHAVQWAAGLELALKWDNPWQYALSVDHPNGGSFLNYPSLIAALMNKPYRDEELARLNKAATRHTDLASLTREMSLSDIATITRAAPAKALGLANKGHLGIGAEADITIYDDNPADPQRMFASPRHVFSAPAPRLRIEC